MQTLFLLRHAQAESNAQNYFGGWTDSQLTELGRKQANILGKRLLRENIDKVFCSDLVRAKQTFQSIGLNCPVEYTEKLREKNYGVKEGLPWTEEDKPAHTDPNHAFEEGENAFDVQKRVWNFFEENVFPCKGSALVVSHHGPLITFTCKMLGMDLKNWRSLQLGNCGLSIFNFEENVWRLKLWNSLSHYGLESEKPLFEENV